MQFPEAQMTMLISCNIENNKYKPQRIFIIAEFPNHRVQVNNNIVPVSIKEVLGNKFR